MITKLNFSESHDMLARGGVTLLDVREEAEYITGHAVGAELLPVDEQGIGGCGYPFGEQPGYGVLPHGTPKRQSSTYP